MPRPPVEITLDGKRRNLTEWCRLLGLPYARVRNRIRLLGWPPDQALELVPRVKPVKAPRFSRRRLKNNKVTYQGISATIAEHCRRLGLPLPRTYGRYDYGLPLDEVFSPDKRVRQRDPSC